MNIGIANILKNLSQNCKNFVTKIPLIWIYLLFARAEGFEPNGSPIFRASEELERVG
jgi:hypothetical protein